MKAQTSRKIDKLQKQITFLQQSVIEKDKEIKMHQVKLREFMQKNKSTLPIRTFEEIETIICAEEELGNTV